jgi:hypothetical protein
MYCRHAKEKEKRKEKKKKLNEIIIQVNKCPGCTFREDVMECSTIISVT